MSTLCYCLFVTVAAVQEMTGINLDCISDTCFSFSLPDCCRLIEFLCANLVSEGQTFISVILVCYESYIMIL